MSATTTPADPILDQLAATWRDMDPTERRCVVLHAGIMRAALAIAKIVNDELRQYPKLGDVIVVLDPAQIPTLLQLQAELHKAGATWGEESRALILHFSGHDRGRALALVDSVLAEFHRRTPVELVARIAERARPDA